MGHRMLPIGFFLTDPRCHGNEVWDKIGYSSACVRDFCKIFAHIRGLWGWAIECCQSNFLPTDPRCHGNEIWDKIGYNSACLRIFLRNFCAYRKIFVDGPSNTANCIFPPTDSRCHDNEIRDKIGYNSACVKDICEIFCICIGVFGNGLSNAANWILPLPTLVSMATKFKTKWDTSACTTNITKILASDEGAGWGFGN